MSRDEAHGGTMGELTGQVMEGACCAMCYAPFRHDNGFPAICWECWKKAKHDASGFVGDAQKSIFPVMR